MRYRQILLDLIRGGLIVPYRDGDVVRFQVTVKGFAERLAAESQPTSRKPRGNAEA